MDQVVLLHPLMQTRRQEHGGIAVDVHKSCSHIFSTYTAAHLFTQSPTGSWRAAVRGSQLEQALGIFIEEFALNFFSRRKPADVSLNLRAVAGEALAHGVVAVSAIHEL